MGHVREEEIQRSVKRSNYTLTARDQFKAKSVFQLLWECISVFKNHIAYNIEYTSLILQQRNGFTFYIYKCC